MLRTVVTPLTSAAKMAGRSSKKELRRAVLGERNSSRKASPLPPPPPPPDKKKGEEEEVVKLPADEFYQKLDGAMNEVPEMGKAFDGILRNMIRFTVPSWTRRFGALPCLRRNNLAWLQLLQVDEQKTAQLKLYELGSRVALTEDDSNVVERSRELFKDAAPFFMKDYNLWICSRSLVRKRYNGVIDHDALDFASHDPLGCLDEYPMDPSCGVRCAEIFLFFAVNDDVPGDALCSRDAVIAYLQGLKSEEGARKIQAFSVVAGSVVAAREKLQELRGEHISA